MVIIYLIIQTSSVPSDIFKGDVIVFSKIPRKLQNVMSITTKMIMLVRIPKHLMIICHVKNSSRNYLS